MKEPIDQIAKHENIIKHDFGQSFPLPLRVGGWLFTIFGTLSIFGVPILGIPLAIGGLYAIATKHGVLLDTTNKFVKFYTNHFGFITKGDWQSLEKYPYITLLKSNKGYRMTSMANAQSTIEQASHDVVLLSETHRKKLVVASYPTREQALEQLQELAGKMSIKIADYRPKRIRKSRTR